MLVRLTKKLANVLDGIDISHCVEGDIINLPDPHARVLVAEGWAEAVASTRQTTCVPRASGQRATSTTIDDDHASPEPEVAA